MQTGQGNIRAGYPFLMSADTGVTLYQQTGQHVADAIGSRLFALGKRQPGPRPGCIHKAVEFLLEACVRVAVEDRLTMPPELSRAPLPKRPAIDPTPPGDRRAAFRHSAGSCRGTHPGRARRRGRARSGAVPWQSAGYGPRPYSRQRRAGPRASGASRRACRGVLRSRRRRGSPVS